MRHPDTKLLEGTIEDLRFIIARNKSNHIIKYGQSTMSHFDKKAERIKLPTLNDVISWFEKHFEIDLTDKLSESKQAPNSNFKATKIVESENGRQNEKTKWIIGGKLQERYRNILPKVSEYN